MVNDSQYYYNCLRLSHPENKNEMFKILYFHWLFSSFLVQRLIRQQPLHLVKMTHVYMDKIHLFSPPELPTRWQLLQMPLPPTLYHMIHMYWSAKVVENSSHVNHFTIESVGVSLSQIVGPKIVLILCSAQPLLSFSFFLFLQISPLSLSSSKQALEWAHTDDSIIVKCCKYTGLTLHHLRVKAAIWKKPVRQRSWIFYISCFNLGLGL